jgi:hypothetical protein
MLNSFLYGAMSGHRLKTRDPSSRMPEETGCVIPSENNFHYMISLFTFSMSNSYFSGDIYPRTLTDNTRDFQKPMDTKTLP